ncbi:MAG TPA: 4-hydroxy-2-oxoheptanedioate aldolase [Rhodanobacter sp.]|jgi:4-hydroxy-2-oxoheptanedioate aldolase
MKLPENSFKRALAQGQPQFGLWAALADPYVAEVLATAGFDWLLIDIEHAPNDLRSTLGQLQAVAPYATHPVVRPVRSERALIKRLLDIGAQTLLVPMIDTAEQAAEVVAATRYPPHGVRGVGSSLARASRWNHVPDYLTTAASELCVLVQVETVTGLANLEAIVHVDGVDGVFFGPSDLSASMGLLGKAGDPAVRDAVLGGIRIVCAAHKAAGVLTTDRTLARAYLDAGALFVAVGTDIGILGAAAAELKQAFVGVAGAAVGR